MIRDYKYAGVSGRDPEAVAFHRWDPVSDLQVLYSGFHVCPPGHGWRGRRNHALVHHILSGHGRVRWGKKEWPLGPGDSFLFFPNENLWYEADREQPWRYLWVGLGGVRLTHYLELSGLRRHQPALPAAQPGQIIPSFQQILEVLEDETLAAQHKTLRVQSLAFSLLEGLSHSPEALKEPSNAPAKDVPYVQEIMKFLEQAYSRRITTDTIARFAGLERTYCCHLFSTTTGQSLMQYLTELRMDKAAELLQGTNLSVRAIAESVGYTDAGVFSKRFKKSKGITPTAVRRSPTE